MDTKTIDSRSPYLPDPIDAIVVNAMDKTRQRRFQNDLNESVLIHVCRDRTLSFRTKDEPVFNGVALPVFSVPSKEIALALITLVGVKQYHEHPLLPGQDWLKIDLNTRYLDYNDLPAVTAKLKKAYALLNPNVYNIET